MTDITRVHRRLFKNGSRTYFNSSFFFPKSIRRDVYILYGFVRLADNYVDSVPQDREGFYRFQNRYRLAFAGTPSGETVIDTFVDLIHRRGFDPEWVDAFLFSMEQDLTKRNYDSLDETLRYIYGSAEVIGLFMAKILDLDPESYQYAQYLGRAMQYINFIRDIHEDRSLGRRYLPLTETSLSSLSEEQAVAQSEEFRNFIREQVKRYLEWQTIAEKGYRYMPKRYLVPVKTASDMYSWTARALAKDPFMVFRQKVKPTKIRIFTQALKNIFGI